MTEVTSEMQECPQLKILRIEGSIYFGACDHVQRHLDDQWAEGSGQKHLLLMSKSINFVDLAGADLIVREARRRNKAGGGLYLYSPRQPVEALLHHCGYMKEIGVNHVFFNKDEAIREIFAGLQKSVCASCKKKIFVECHSS